MRTAKLACELSSFGILRRLGFRFIFIILIASTAAGYPVPGHNDRVGVNMQGGAPSAGCSYPSITPDAHFVAFQTLATDLVSGDNNLNVDVYLRDRFTDTNERISLSSDGTQPNAPAWDPSISGDGRLVAFRSEASNLVPLDSNSATDIFVRDRQTGHSERVSVATDGAQGNGASVAAAISRDGRYVAFQSDASNLVSSDTNGASDIFVHDRQTQTTERVSVGMGGAEANGKSYRPAISSDGRLVFFYSDASNLVSSDTNGVTDLFVYDRQTGVTARLSVASDGSEANDMTFPTARPAISGDGRYVAFFSAASNLVPSDTNNNTDCFVHDRQTGSTERVSVPSDGSEPDFGAGSITLGISDDGRYVAFEASAHLSAEDTNNLTDIYVVDRQTGQAEVVSTTDEGWSANDNSFAAVLDSSGRHPAFATFGTNLDNIPPPGGQFYTSLFTRDRGPAVGVLKIMPSKVDDQVAVLGTARYGGVVIASADDPTNDGSAGADQLGAELTGASITYRPEVGDLFVRIGLNSIPSSATPGIIYDITFQLGGQNFEIRGSRVQAGATSGPDFELLSCDSGGSCTQTAQLKGGVGTVRNDVRFSIPMSSLGAVEGSAVTSVHVSSGIGDVNTGVLSILDEMDLPAATIPQRQVTAGFAPPGTPESQVNFSFSGNISDADYYASFGALPPGQWDLWARACLGNECGSAAFQNYGTPLPPVQLVRVVSRKAHGSAGTFDLDLTNATGIECRSGGANGDYTLVFTFANPLASVDGANITSGTASIISNNIDASDAHNYLVSLTGVANAQTISVSLTNVRDSLSNFSSSVPISMGVLLGDVNASRRVDAADVSFVRQQTLQMLDNSNFRADVNASGRIDAADVSIARQQTLTSLP